MAKPTAGIFFAPAPVKGATSVCTGGEPPLPAKVLVAAPSRVVAPRLDTTVVETAVVSKTVELPDIEVLVIMVDVENVDKIGKTMPTLPKTAVDCEAATEKETPIDCPTAAVTEESEEDDL